MNIIHQSLRKFLILWIKMFKWIEAQFIRALTEVEQEKEKREQRTEKRENTGRRKRLYEIHVVSLHL